LAGNSSNRSHSSAVAARLSFEVWGDLSHGTAGRFAHDAVFVPCLFSQSRDGGLGGGAAALRGNESAGGYRGRCVRRAEHRDTNSTRCGGPERATKSAGHLAQAPWSATVGAADAFGQAGAKALRHDATHVGQGEDLPELRLVVPGSRLRRQHVGLENVLNFLLQSGGEILVRLLGQNTLLPPERRPTTALSLTASRKNADLGPGRWYTQHLTPRERKDLKAQPGRR
jgi:hypothetical protein